MPRRSLAFGEVRRRNEARENLRTFLPERNPERSPERREENGAAEATEAEASKRIRASAEDEDGAGMT